MLRQISWLTYAVSILLFTSVYYLYIGLTFYRLEIRAFFYRLTGRQPVLKSTGQGDVEFTDYGIMGKAQPDDIAFVRQDELSFGPTEIPDETADQGAILPSAHAGTNSRLAGDFSEMATEVKTLVRVINESGESKENFEMLFRLIAQKFPALTGTPYQQQINGFLVDEGAPQFPFSLTHTDLENYWIN
jgi:hypothetical protein